ncbi:ADP-ribosylation factor GTPase-activating protein AGD4-like isoform X1 [Carex rostrata]
MEEVFANLEDSPMFRKKVSSMEASVDELKDRCEILQDGSKGLMKLLGDAYKGDLSFAGSLEAFGAGKDDHLSVAVGGPVLAKFTAFFKELGTYKDLLCSQVDHMLSARLSQFINVDLQNVKDCRQRLDKATIEYDQARERCMSVKKGTKPEVVADLEEDLQNSKSTFERCRFNLVTALANIEAKKKYEFLEATSSVVDAHLRYFKQGYEMLSKLESFVEQVLTYCMQSREAMAGKQDKLAKRIQEFRIQDELANSRFFSSRGTSTSDMRLIGTPASNGEVQIIKQGYLLKRSSNLRADWRRRFFVLDSHGTLFYYRNKGGQSQQSNGSSEGSGMFGRFKISNQKSPSKGEDHLGYQTVDLRIATIKLDSEQSNLRFSFRLISPVKTFTLQAENEADRMDWIEKITGAITSLLNSVSSGQISSGGSEIGDGTITMGKDSDSSVVEEAYNKVINIMRGIPGNEKCAECEAPSPEWASLNLGILVCIECSGAHRNLGVHISKVRSLTLDVKVWDPVVIDLFQSLGNTFSNSVWDELLLHDQNEGMDESDKCIWPIGKPNPNDSFSRKEKYIQSKYADRSFLIQETDESFINLWEAIKSNDIKETYRLLIKSSINPNIRYDDIISNNMFHIFEMPGSKSREYRQNDLSNCQNIMECFQGCSLLHFACQTGNTTMAELLLQFGADINAQDFHGRTALHHSALIEKDDLAKYLLKRGARTTITDGGGLTALERRMDLGAITDDELFILFVNDSGNTYRN